MDKLLMERIHEDTCAKKDAFFDGIDESRRIVFDIAIDGLTERCEPIRFIVQRQRFEDGPPVWNVSLLRDGIDQRARDVTSWPIPVKLLFLEHADYIRDEYLLAIESFEAMVRRRYG